MKSLNHFVLVSAVAFALLPIVSHAQGQFYLKPYLGFSALSDQSAETNDIGSGSGTADFELDSGIVGGLGFGYRYNKNIAAEIAWEYRTNDSETTLSDGMTFSEGNYASNILYVNGYYFMDTTGSWAPYIGSGLGWIQEIDIDFESNGTEQSYSGDGEVAFQVMAGVEYSINENIRFNAEARYSGTSVDLDGEDTVGSITGLDYDPITLQLGVAYNF